MASEMRVPYTSATLKGLRVYGGLFVAAILVALPTLTALPTTQAAKTEPRSAKAVSATEEASKSPGVSKRAKRSAYDKLALNKLTIERPAPKKPAPAPEPEQNKEAERSPQAGATSVSVLPGPSRKASARRAPARKAPEKEAPEKEAAKRKAPEVRQRASARATKPHNARLLLSIPRLGIKDITLGNSSEQAHLDWEGIMHFSGTGFPYQRGSNTYIVGHAGDYDTARVPNPFRNLKELGPGELIILRDATGRTYNYRVYERFVVSPRDVWVMDPVAGRNVVTLQTCFPVPIFDERLIVRGELVR
jgi:sortase A